MLKIVDYYPGTTTPFPLKKLEKFGFRQDPHMLCYSILREEKYSSYGIRVFEDREIETIVCSSAELPAKTNGLPELLYDLIRAGIVEKVGPDNDN